MRKIGLIGALAAGFVISSPAVLAAAGTTVHAGCLGVDRAATGDQTRVAEIRVAMRVDAPAGVYRAAFTGPGGPVEGVGQVASGLGLALVPVTRPGSYSGLTLTDVDTGQSVDPGPLTALLPLVVSDTRVTCDVSSLAGAAPSRSTTPTSPPASTPDRVGGVVRVTHTADAPPWLLLLVPGGVLVIGGIVLLVRARSGPRSRGTT
jgi:hypothetical protein